MSILKHGKVTITETEIAVENFVFGKYPISAARTTSTNEALLWALGQLRKKLDGVEVDIKRVE